MPIKTIAVALLGGAETDWLIPAACTVARHWRAHLIGVHPVEPFVPYMGTELGMVAPLAPMFLDWQITETEAIKARFDHFAGQEDFGSEWRGQSAVTVGSEYFLLDNLHPADLVILGQTNPETARRDQVRLQEHAIRQSGRPVLMIPQGSKSFSLAQHPMIGWSNTREAARAAHDAMVLFAPGAQVDILHIGATGGGIDPDTVAREDLAASLDRHGFKANLVTREKGAMDISDALMQAAFENGADLIVSGAFGHSRAFDFVVGAVTRSLMEKSGLPVLLSK